MSAPRRNRGAGRRTGAGRPPGALLVVDIGNTRIKWARWRAGRFGAEGGVTHAEWRRGRFARETLAALGPVRRVVVASVAAPRFAAGFGRLARRTLGCEVQFIVTTARAAGVTNAYAEPWRLGTDRWAGVIAAHHLFAPPRNVCIANLGTATTIDLVDARGRHRGGAILPGPDLMLRALLAGTSGIRRRAAGARPRAGRTAFARNTRDALETGARYATAAAIERFAGEARQLLGRRVTLVLTGGAAADLAPLVRDRHRVIPDLVLRGLLVLGAAA